MIFYKYINLGITKVSLLFVVFIYFLKLASYASPNVLTEDEFRSQTIREYSNDTEQRVTNYRQSDAQRFSIKDTSKIRFTVDTIFINLNNADLDQVKHFLNKLPYKDGLSLYEYFKDISINLDSLFCRIEAWIRPSVNSPYFIKNKADEIQFRISEENSEVEVDEDFYFMVKFILSLSQTRYYYGNGPTIRIYTTNRGNEEISLNYSQLLGAITWYKLNLMNLSNELFLLFMMSKTANNYILFINEFEFAIIMSTEFLYPLIIRDDDDDRVIVFDPPRVPKRELDRLFDYERKKASDVILKQKRVIPFLNLTIDYDSDYSEFLNYQESFTYPKFHRLYGY